VPLWLTHFGHALKNAYRDVLKNHTMAFAAALSYYFVLSLFPLLIALAAVVGYLPIPDLFNHILDVMSRVVPSQSMGLVRKIVASVISPSKGKLLTVGLIGTLWSASSGFASMIEALNVAYDVPETRPYWKTRSLAFLMTFVIGALMVIALSVLIVGPSFGSWFANKVDLGPQFVIVWPSLRWGVSVGFTVLAIELLYFIGPNVKQRFLQTLVGAIFAVGGWIGLSYLLGLYFQHFSSLNKTYGVLGGAIALFMWFYWTSLAILVGAEINSELLQETGNGKLPLKQPPPAEVTPKVATEADLAA
jgi:membrane protein